MGDRTCAIDTCPERPDGQAALGWCKKHFTRYRRHGDPMGGQHRDRTDLERFNERIEKTADCWNWVGSIASNGYGRFRDGIWAHRASYELHTGPIPDGLVIDHLCRNPRCVNPAHLEAVTHRENVRRGLSPLQIGEMHRSKTHCPQGHPYDEANTYINPHWNPSRSCRACARERNRRRRVARNAWQREWRRKKREAEKAKLAIQPTPAVCSQSASGEGPGR